MAEKDVKSQLIRALEDWDVVAASDCLSCPSNHAWVAENSMELVPVVAQHLTEHTEMAGPHMAQCCQDLLVTLANKGSAKENLVAILEQLDSFQASVSVRRVLPGLAIVLTRIKQSSMSVSWAWALSTVACHLRTCTVPDNLGLEGVERLSLDQTGPARECIDMLDALADFIDPLINIVKTSVDEADNKCRKSVLLYFLLSALSRPLSFLSQHPESDPTGLLVFPASHAAAARLVTAVAEVTTNILDEVVKFPDSKERKSLQEDEPLDQTSISVFLYLLLGEGLCLDKVPAVYSKLYLLQRSSPHISLLLKEPQEIRVHKGLLLLEKLLSSITPSSLPPTEAENPALVSLMAPLVNVIVYQDVAELRKLGFACYSKFVNMFNLNGRYSVYNHLLNTVNHSGLLGWTISSLKDSIALSLAKYAESKPAVLYPEYTGHSLARIVLPLFRLANGAETDLLEVSDEVLATINFAHFLLVRDKENISGIQDMKSEIKNWVEMLTEGLKLSTAHYEQKLKEPFDDGSNMNVTVGGRDLPAMDEKKLKEVVRSALNTFSLIQFNLVRVKEQVEK
eukprot:GFUD01011035.1.p1 GENE.GFUD01011035.1~~GFUD01011035.1.p1  ORF type:complete len:567 (-),score=197.57 GFUD01011035.1:38-1738(-)